VVCVSASERFHSIPSHDCVLLVARRASKLYDASHDLHWLIVLRFQVRMPTRAQAFGFDSVILALHAAAFIVLTFATAFRATRASSCFLGWDRPDPKSSRVS
jgi:hypothetical protein